MKKNRWLIALSAIAIHLSIGSVYSYSVLKNPISDQIGWSDKTVTVAFTLAIGLLGTSAAFFGKSVEKWGPKKSAIIAAILFGAGQLITGISLATESLILFYFGYGIVGGMGLGLGYIAPVSTLVKWFPDRRGLATGMAVMGFGAGSLIGAPVITGLIRTVGLSNTFFILAAIYFTLMFSGALYIVRPPENWVPFSKAAQQTKKTVRVQQSLQQLTAREAVRTNRFWLLWLMMFINISNGIMLISVASPFAQSKVGMTATAAATMVGIMGLFNGGGRIGWSAFSDFMGRSNVFLMFFSVQFILMLTLPNVTNALLLQILIFVVISMYGGSFALLPAFVSDLFGTKELGAIHGLLLTSWSCAGVFGPLLVAFINDTTGSYNAAFYIFSGLLAVAFVVSILMKLSIKAFNATSYKKVS